MNKKVWRKRWLSSINELTSLEIQKKKWMDNNTNNPHWTYIEFTNCYFDDLIIENNYEYPLRNEYIDKNEFEIIKEWHFHLSNYVPPNGDLYNHKAILTDPNWLELVNQGTEMKRNLSSVLNEEEKNILNEKLN